MLVKRIYVVTLSALSLGVFAQVDPPKGSQTYSPYTPEQLRELNNQPLSPTEGPFGPVETPSIPAKPQAKKSLSSGKYFSPPQGEEEAEALETESAEPYTPATPIYRF